MSVTGGTNTFEEEPIAVDPTAAEPIVVDASMAEPIAIDASLSHAKAEVRDVLNRVYDEYHKFSEGSSSASQTSFDKAVHQPRLGSEQIISLQSKFQKHLEKVEIDGGKSEIDKYLEESCEKDASINILDWWKMNSCKYKVLSEVARDVLAIPVSTVASEAAFSTGGRVIDQFRSSLTPKLVECLICMQDWFRATPFPFEMEESMAEMEELELALNKAPPNVILD